MNRRQFAACGLGLGLQGLLPHRLHSQQSVATRTPGSEIDPFSMVDPELLPAVKGSKLGTLDDEIVLASQKATASMATVIPEIPGVPITRRLIKGPSGAPDVPIFIADTAPAKKLKPAILHIHGGGYVLGNPQAFMPSVIRYAKPSECVVVSVDYRLAPGTKFPGSLEDNYAALLWLHRNAPDLGVDPTRIAVAGESAGGGHAAALAIHARDKDEVPLVFQLLIYPMLDDRTGSTRPVPSHIGRISWGEDGNRYGWTSLLGVPAGSTRVPYGSVPARVENLAGLPPAFIGVGAIDLFVDEDIEYARRLIDAAVPTQLVVVPGAYHGFDLTVPNARASTRFVDDITVALQRAFTPKPQTHP